MDSSNQVEILDEVFKVSLSANAFEKGRNLSYPLANPLVLEW